jgi:hypothetical protein
LTTDVLAGLAVRHPASGFCRRGVLFGIDCNGNARSLDEIADRAYEILLACVGRCLVAPVQQQAQSEITSD